jgi:hypothetical protein
MAILDTIDNELANQGLNPAVVGAMLRRRAAGLDPNVGTGAPLIPRLGGGRFSLETPEQARTRLEGSALQEPAPKLGVEPKPPVPKLGLADQYKTLSAQRPTPDQFNEGFKRASLGRKILGTLGTIGAGIYDFGMRDPNMTLARNVEQRMFHPQYTRAMENYQARLGDVGNEAKLGLCLSDEIVVF